MSEISIKVQLGTRTYPLSVNPEEEALIRAAAQHVNDSIKSLQDSYAVKDIQDLLAMTALQMATQVVSRRNEVEPKAPVPTHQADLEAIDHLLSDYLTRL